MFVLLVGLEEILWQKWLKLYPFLRFKWESRVKYSLSVDPYVQSLDILPLLLVLHDRIFSVQILFEFFLKLLRQLVRFLFHFVHLHIIPPVYFTKLPAFLCHFNS